MKGALLVFGAMAVTAQAALNIWLVYLLPAGLPVPFWRIAGGLAALFFSLAEVAVAVVCLCEAFDPNPYTKDDRR